MKSQLYNLWFGLQYLLTIQLQRNELNEAEGDLLLMNVIIRYYFGNLDDINNNDNYSRQHHINLLSLCSRYISLRSLDCGLYQYITVFPDWSNVLYLYHINVYSRTAPGNVIRVTIYTNKINHIHTFTLLKMMHKLIFLRKK